MSYCDWDKASPVTRKYHDMIWGVPLHDDIGQFEFLMMEVMQCGLNWDLVMNKRDILRRCFDGFDFEKIALYGAADVTRIMATEGMIKSVRKINAVINNAKCFQKIRAEFKSFDAYLWRYSSGKTILYDKHDQGYIPASNGLAQKISDDLKKRGLQFIGPITVYSHLQACGIINDHDSHCAQYRYINTHYPTVKKPRDREEGVKFYGDKKTDLKVS
ncbi:MAG: DNA-3-methyladenine glycosylase I [Alphaproteobacteria bacterium]|nr:DNA-3-methyladenine glycosylase I [Alphaproteobacteria bacterium]